VEGIDNKPGEIIEINKHGILVGCKQNCILITKLQIPGKTPIEVKQIINGNHQFKIGTKFI
jgi:methionyl-tRNA formyltransferase